VGSDPPLIYDITRPVSEDLACWPGDTPFSFRLTARIEDRESVNVGEVRMSVHTGTHLDAPFHFDSRAVTVDALSLEALVGPAVVVDVTGQDPIGPAALSGLDLGGAPRLLLKTGGWPDPSRFPDRVPVLAPKMPEWLRERGVCLVGLDVPSVDALDSKTLPIHHALNAAGIRILEGLRLEGVVPGRYELIALPLRLTGADGAPVRAILRPLEVER
jgi:arylformamidase